MEEVANVVVFVASKEAAVTNGAAIRAEGRVRMIVPPRFRAFGIEPDRIHRGILHELDETLAGSPMKRTAPAAP